MGSVDWFQLERALIIVQIYGVYKEQTLITHLTGHLIQWSSKFQKSYNKRKDQARMYELML